MFLLLEQILNGLQLGVFLFLIAAGLTLIFGIMGVINLAHGSLYMVGAFAAAGVVVLLRRWRPDAGLAPTMLVAAFRATLEEVVAADVILHVRDISHPETEAQRLDVEQVLADLLDTDAETAAPIVEVWNKIDLVTDPAMEAVSAARQQAINLGSPPVLTSAVTGQGLDDLCRHIDDIIGRGDVTLRIVVPAAAGKLRHWLHENATVLRTEVCDDNTGASELEVRISNVKHGQLLHRLEELGLSAAH